MPRVTLPATLSAISGKLGDVVYVQTRNGTYTRRYTVPHNPDTAAQQQVRANLTVASQTFKALEPSQAEAWREYGRSQRRRNRINGKVYTLTAYHAFMTLAIKYGQIHPGSVPPVLPPGTSFTGDTFTVRAEAVPGGIVWTATGDNAPNVLTELLAMPLTSLRVQRPPQKYRTQGFVEFRHDENPFFTPLPSGLFAPGYRFVQTETGQATLLIPLSPVLVPEDPTF